MDCDFVTDCYCKAKCGEVHGTACSDQNCLRADGFIATCEKHRAENRNKHRSRIEQFKEKYNSWN